MGLLALVRRTFASNPVTAVKAASAAAWAGASVGFQAVYKRRGLYTNHYLQTKMAVQWVGICSQFNAQQCAGCTLRLYRPSGSRGKVKAMGGRAVKGNRRLRYLHDRSPYGPGKAAEYAEAAGDIEEVTDSPILDFLANPNSRDNWLAYATRLFQAKWLTGNGYELKVNGGESPQLLPLLPMWTRVEPSMSEVVSGYIYGKSGAREERYDLDEVIHHKHMSALDNLYYGIGPLTNVMAEADIYAAATAYELATMENGMRPGDIQIVCAEGTLPVQVEQIRAELMKRYMGPTNAGTPMILVDSEAKPLTRTNKDMEYQEGLKSIEKRILTAFGIPEALLTRSDGGVISGESGKSKSQTYTTYVRTTILPSIRGSCDLWNTDLLPWLGYEPGELWFAYDDPCPEDVTDLDDRAAKLIPIGAWTLNDYREEAGKEPFEGEDIPRWQGQPLVSAEDAAKAREAALKQPEPGAKPKPGEKSYRVTKDVGPDDEATAPIEKRMDREVRAFFAESAPLYVAHAASGAVPASMPTGVAEVYVRSTASGYARAVEAGSAAAKVGPFGFGERAAQYIERLQLDAVKSIDATTREILSDALAEGIRAGDTGPQLTARASDVLGPSATKSRAEMIAQTEVSRAFNGSRIEAWKESGRVVSKEYLPSGDPCPVCADLSGKVVPLDAEFAPGVPHPPTHPRCRCSVAAVFKEAT